MSRLNAGKIICKDVELFKRNKETFKGCQEGRHKVGIFAVLKC